MSQEMLDVILLFVHIPRDGTTCRFQRPDSVCNRVEEYGVWRANRQDSLRCPVCVVLRDCTRCALFAAIVRGSGGI